ncbi:unannotated protein [freshwater metagenome]|uniref:Unannotated protein n=1 Tax=freshwater metagenome TaxID=449393 RepID=A0A6J7D3Y5_9ZZZZ|nr:hypothetical protein [Actinomycetota bacterium]
MTDVRPETGSLWVEIITVDAPQPAGRIPRPVAVAGEATLGAAVGAARLGVAAGLLGWRAAGSAGRALGALPGVATAGRMAEAAVEPLAQDGRRIRGDVSRASVEALQAALETIVTRVLLVTDVDAIVRRVDVDAIIDRIDVNDIIDRIDIEAIVEETRLGTIVARSTSGFASEALDAAREQTATVDGLAIRIVNRLLRREEADLPLGPPLLFGNDVPDSANEDGDG